MHRHTHIYTHSWGVGLLQRCLSVSEKLLGAEMSMSQGLSQSNINYKHKLPLSKNLKKEKKEKSSLKLLMDDYPVILVKIYNNKRRERKWWE